MRRCATRAASGTSMNRDTRATAAAVSAAVGLMASGRALSGGSRARQSPGSRCRRTGHVSLIPSDGERAGSACAQAHTFLPGLFPPLPRVSVPAPAPARGPYRGAGRASGAGWWGTGRGGVLLGWSGRVVRAGGGRSGSTAVRARPGPGLRASRDRSGGFRRAGTSRVRSPALPGFRAWGSGRCWRSPPAPRSGSGRARSRASRRRSARDRARRR